jgi:hypothetical protein
MGIVERLQQAALAVDPEEMLQMCDELTTIQNHAKILADRRQISMEEYTKIVKKFHTIKARSALREEEETKIDE